MEHSFDFSPLNVLIVDDTNLMRAMHRKHLVELGFSPENLYEAQNGQVGLGILQSFYKEKKEIHLIISDWDMPILTGFDFLKKVRSINMTKAIPFIMVTGHDKKEDYANVVKSGVNGIIMKPFKPDLYYQKIIEVMSKKLMSGV